MRIRFLRLAVTAAGNQTKVTIERNTGLAPSEIEEAATGLGEHACGIAMMQMRRPFSRSVAGRSQEMGRVEQV